MEQWRAHSRKNVRPNTVEGCGRRLACLARGSVLVLLFTACGSQGDIAPNLSLASTTYVTESAPANQPLIPFIRTDSSQCLGLEDASLRFSDGRSVDEVRRYLMPAVAGTQGLPVTQSIVVETSQLTYAYDAGSGILVINRGAVADTGHINMTGGANIVLQEHFESVSYCRSTGPVSVLYHRT